MERTKHVAGKEINENAEFKYRVCLNLCRYWSTSTRGLMLDTYENNKILRNEKLEIKLRFTVY